ncbi:hypothetical protein ABDK09_02060 [Vibrio sp. CDRSL-10 TSBA]
MSRFYSDNYLELGASGPVPLCWHKEEPESAFVSLPLAGPVLGVPYAKNLKIRPEFLPYV